jgi:hypothetical protein
MLRRSAVIAVGCATVGVAALGLVPRAVAGRDATHVVAVHAGGGTVPSNLLRAYVELSGPMEPGSAYEHIRLVDEAGRAVSGAFLELREELWSGDHRRLTLLFDPGRVKRGIQSNMELGPPLVAGREYSIVIDSTWRDASNRPLASNFEQRLRVVGFDSTSPDPSRWSLSTPHAGSREELRVDFGESLDHALASRVITVVDSSGSRLTGRIWLGTDDRVWHFTPQTPWREGAALRIAPELEDLGGNNLIRVFDLDRSRESASATTRPDSAPRLIAVPLRARRLSRGQSR